MSGRAPIVIVAGGIGSGKSLVAHLMSDYGAAVVDLDAIGRDVLRDPDVASALAHAFGPDVVDSDGRVDAAALARAAFSTPEGTETLNGITHPAIIEAARARSEALALTHPLVAVEVSAGEATHERYPWSDVVVAVVAPLETRIARVVARGRQREEDARARASRQPDEATLRAWADYTIANDGRIEDVEKQVRRLVDVLTGFPPGARRASPSDVR
ncbi:dephospho-CoA kinase [Slackia exigua]|uniref:dephospho-CoA kinase n=1 Tax=Slackia exigua TaxID=84109 RepID=UPI00210D78FC|nr:dephospho-CoA kinase [Slackia exigua]MCQ5090788.1 dephospho-CoA kinase [Slackia exigua]